jgi:hypothetical protein
VFNEVTANVRVDNNEESYETMKRHLDEALKEVSVWKKRR